MSNLGELTEEIALRFDLGRKARTVVQELLNLMAAQPGGIDGFLDEIRGAGLAEKAASWLGDPYPMALSTREVKRALGAEIIKEIAGKTGLTEAFTSKVLGHAIPKLIGLLAADCPVPEAAPARLSFPHPAHPSASPRFETFTFWRNQMPKFGTEGIASAVPLVIPAIAVLVTVGLFWHSITAGTAGDHLVFQPVPIMAENAPVTSPEPLAVSEAVANNADPAAVSGPLKSALGAGKSNGSFVVMAGWVQNLSALAELSNCPDSRAPFAGNEFNVGGTTSHANRAWMVASMQSAQLPQFVLAALTGGGAVNMRIASSTSKSGSSGNESARPTEQALDFPIITFPANGAKVPSRSIPVLRRVAMRIKLLPPGTVVQLNGYTHGTRVSAADVELAQRRADSVSEVLIEEGVSPAMLWAKGYGSASLSAGNGPMEGRSSTMGERFKQNDRRVEFRVIQHHP